mgnify:CR=1 FL=1
MDETDFEPRNDIERLLVDMLEGSVEPEDFARRIMDMQVFMPVKDEKHQIAGFQLSTQAAPLVLEDDDGNRAMIIFTGPDRAKDFLAEFPNYGGGLLTEMSWILRRMSADLAIALNPGMVAMLAALLPDEEK